MSLMMEKPFHWHGLGLEEAWLEEPEANPAGRRWMDWHVRESRAVRAERVLDMKCGGGTMLRRLVETHGVGRAVGLTLIESQRNHIESCPDERIEVCLGSWRDYAPKEPFKSIICMGAFEAVAERDLSPIQRAMAYRRFFERCHAWLKPGGRLSLQSIHVNGGAEDLGLLFRQYIFPHSDLPRLSEMVTAVEQIFEIRTLRESRGEVALACQNACQRLQRAGHDQARMIRCLQYLGNGFNTGSLGLVRMSLRRIG